MIIGLAVFLVGVWVVVVILSRKGMPLAGAITLAIVIQVGASLFAFMALIVAGVALQLFGLSSDYLGLVTVQLSPFGVVLGLFVAYALPTSQEAARMQTENRPHLVACPECGRQNASTTRICPQCGYREPQQKNPLSTDDLAVRGEPTSGEPPTTG
jgi:hypothetical protein